MSRRCLYCAKELPKTATNNFCSKECWTEYKKLKALDIGTDRQATVLLKRSDVVESIDAGLEPDFQLSDRLQDTVGELSADHHFDQAALDGAGLSSTTKSAPDRQQDSVSSKKIEALSTRLATLENLLTGKSSARNIDASEPLVKQIENLAIRLNKLEVDLEKVDIFLRSADKYEDRIRRIERRLEEDPLLEPAKKQGFFARLFS
ncbi:MAG: hypothetical protein WBM02_10965 [bacterium]